MRKLITLFSAAMLLAAQEVSQSGLELRAERAMIAQAERAPHAMVATVNELATQAGLGILKAGGNAVDAAVTIAAVLAVVHPEAGNLGGGGYMLIRMADGRAKVIDYRETAPGSAHPRMFATPDEARIGYKASAVPGTVAGIAMAREMFGSKPWKQLLEPARRLADKGFPASQRLELILGLQVPVMGGFPETAKVFLHGEKKPLVQAEILRQPDLAATLARMQRDGPREFYEGETARRIAADMAAHKGTITADDLKNYNAIARDPIEGNYRGYRILTNPPSSSGGIALLEMLNILEQFPAKVGEEGSAKSRHLMVEAMRRAYRDRAQSLGDPAFVDVPVARLVSKEHARELAASIQTDRATPGAGRASATEGNESLDTTHFTVIDAAGNLVTNTYTLNGFFGSQVIPKGTGVLLNDIMSGFSTRDGSPNVVGPKRRPLSSMTPAIVCRNDGRNWFALGSPGSATIPNTVLQVIVNIIDYKMSLRDAIEYPRIHHQGTPDRIDAEPGAMVADVAEKLKAMGHSLNPRFRSQGDVHAVMIEEGTNNRLGWSDGRRGGRAIGY